MVRLVLAGQSCSSDLTGTIYGASVTAVIFHKAVCKSNLLLL